MSLYLNLELNPEGTFESCSTDMKFIIDTTKNSYLSIVNLRSNEELAKMFKLLELDTHSICAQSMSKVGGWRCMDCVNNENTVFCQDCWSQMKEKHEGHNIVFLKEVNGTCDCGDHNCIDKEYFCPKHKGIFQSDILIKKYIQTTIGHNLPLKLTAVNQSMFDNMAKYINKAINENKTNTPEFSNNIKEFIDCFGMLCEMSSACCFIIADLLLKKYPFKVKHICLDFDDEGGKMIKESSEGHECTCPFIRYILEFYPGKRGSLIYKLIRNYKLKKAIGLYYLLFYNEFFKKIITDFEDLSVQIIFNDVIKIACNIPGLVDTIFEDMIDIFNIYIKEDQENNKNTSDCLLSKTLGFLDIYQKFELLKITTIELLCDTIYILKPVSLDYLSNNTNIILRLIDLASIFHNVNPVKVILPRPTTNQGFKYVSDLLEIEKNLLEILSIFISVFNFDNNDSVKEIFNYFSKTIQEKIKNELNENEYSFHISLYRAFSIFLNRYCFHEANKNNTNIFKSLNSVNKIMPDFIKCSEEMVKSVYKVFGFITACDEGFFSYYGGDMKQYEYLYYYFPQFINRDFCLLKYLLALKENSKYLGFNEILNLCQVENSNKPIEEYILNADKVASPDLWLNDDNKQYLKFSSKILFIILSLLRNNTSLIWNLSSSYETLHSNKIKDKLIEDILTKDKNNFIELTKELIINQILIKENLAYFTDITDNIFLCLKDFFGEKSITELIISLTNKTLTKDKKAKFSLKDELLYYLDLNYIIYPRHKSKAEKYISDFKSKLVSIFNIHFYPVNKFESRLTQENYNQLYFNEKNFDFLFQFTTFILTQKGYEILNEYFLSVLLNYLSTFLCLENEHFMFLRENLKTNQIIKVLKNNNLNDEVKKSYCIFIEEKFKELGTSDSNDSNDLNLKKEKSDSSVNNVQPVRKSTKITMKEKMKNKFQKKNENLMVKLGVNDLVVEEIKQCTESCIICHKPIELDDITKPYGLIGDFLCDHYVSNAFFQTIRKEYKKYYDNDLFLPHFDRLYYQPLDRRSVRIISCNHYIHFSCFFEQFMDSDLKKSLSVFSCPLCHRLSETCIPMVNNYTEEQTKGYFKGYDFNYIFDIGKQKFEEHEKKMEEERKKVLGKKYDKNLSCSSDKSIESDKSEKEGIENKSYKSLDSCENVKSDKDEEGDKKNNEEKKGENKEEPEKDEEKNEEKKEKPKKEGEKKEELKNKEEKKEESEKEKEIKEELKNKEEKKEEPKKEEEPKKKEEKEEEKKEKHEKEKETKEELKKEEEGEKENKEVKKEQIEKEEEKKEVPEKEEQIKEEKEEETKKEDEKKEEADKKEEPKDNIKEEQKEINKEADIFRKEYPDFVNSCKNFLEGFIGIREYISDINLEDDISKKIISKYYITFSFQLRDFLAYLDNIEEKNFSINLWKNFVLSMRLMLKLDIIKKDNYFMRLFQIIREFKLFQFEYTIEYLIQLDSMKSKTCEILLLLSFFFDYEQIEGYEKYIIYMLLPMYAFGFFLKKIYILNHFRFNEEVFLKYLTSEEMYDYFKQDTSLILIITQIVKHLTYNKAIMSKNIDTDKLSMELNDNLDLLNLSSLKGKSILEILDELDKLIDADKNNEKMKHLYDNLKMNFNYKETFQKLLDEHRDSGELDKVLSPSLFGSCLPTIFRFIELPEFAIDFEYKSYNIQCQVCKVKGKRSLICLDCGKKVCDSRRCLTIFQGQTLPGFIAHTKICGGGRSAFLQTDDCSVLFVSHKAVFRKFVPLYVNEFGEGVNKRNFGKEFKLSQEEVKKALKMFTEYSYTNAEIIA